MTYGQIKRGDNFILQDVEVTAAPVSLTVITGPVGCEANLLFSQQSPGEVSNTSGIVNCKGSVVCVPQIAWVFSGEYKGKHFVW